MNWSSLLGPASILAARLPLDRILIRPRDKARALEEFAATLPATRPPAAGGPTAVPPVSSPVAPEAQDQSGSPVQVVDQPAPLRETVSHQQYMNYQKKQLYGQLWLLQGHLVNGSRIDGEVCDCVVKHSIAVDALAEETQPMDPSNPLWAEIKDFARDVTSKSQVADVIKGTYLSEYPGMAATVRGLRKRIDIGSSPTTLEEAKSEAAKLAEEVESEI